METVELPHKSRIFGLDLMRMVAVSLVVFGHMLQHSRPPWWMKYFGHLGILGVEIFFVLSGFLIGGIIMNLIAKGRFETREDLVHFWSRRWLRTLPLYYLFFLIYLKFDWTGPSRLLDHLDFLVFMQNFAWRSPDFFLLSWSLAIEEHFYLLFPLAYFALQRLNRDPVKSLKHTLGLFLIVPLVVKFLRAPYPEWAGFDFNLRMVVVGRLDSLMYGVGAAFLKHYYPLVWGKLRAMAPVALAAATSVALYIYFDIPGLIPSRWIQTFLFPVTSLSIALCLPFFDSIRSESHSWWRRVVTHVSTISYSTYLGHILVLTLVNRALNAIPNGMTAIYPHPLRLYPIYFVLILVLTPLTYYGWELPFMRLRDHTLPGTKRWRTATGFRFGARG